MSTRTNLVVIALALSSASPSSPSSAGAQELERGRYLVEHVALCVECHTPRDERGELVPSRRLQGAAIPVRSPFPAQTWAFRAPHLAGLPGLTDAEAVRLLTEGIAHTGLPPAPPMPRFRMTRGDAEAVVAYLRSL